MIDLGNKKEDLYSIRLQDKTVLKLKKPTQAMLLTMIALKDTEDAEMLKDLYALLLRIFNRNTIDRVFTLDELEEMLDIEAAIMVFEDYLNSTLGHLGK